MNAPSLPLPIDAHIDRLVATVAQRRSLVLKAPPGAGKSTRLPPALVALGPVFLLQPRRVAARSLARRIAVERGWTPGDEVGWQVRFERQFGAKTRLLVATEGILNARLEADPLLSDFATIVLDEFHERSIHADLGLAFARQAQRARPDLAIVVMSATLGAEAERIASFLGGAPVVEIEGRPHPVAVSYAPGAAMADVIRERLAGPGGHVLCFLAGAREIRGVADALSGISPDATVLPLHGSLDSREQDLALAPATGRKVILATNLAETSLTVEGVTDVVDSGLHKVARFDVGKGIDRLDLERISEDSAAQRAGRAGRTGPGTAIRLWDLRDVLRPHREADVARVDPSGPVLDVLAWGGDARAFEWFEPPHGDRLAYALDLLARLEAIDAKGRLTDLGRQLRRLPLHPRLGRVLVAAGGGRRAAAACAVLAEPRYPLNGTTGTDSDVLSRLDRLGEAPYGVRQVARQIEEIARHADGRRSEADDVTLRRALLAGFPDRLARRRTTGSSRLVLASGQGATLDRASGVTGGLFLLALDVAAGTGSGPGAEAVVRTASLVEREWLTPTAREVVHRFDAEAGCVRAVEQESFGGLVLDERPIAPRPDEASALLARLLLDRGLDEAAEQTLRRLRFAGLPADRDALTASACRGRACLRDVDVSSGVDPALRGDLDRLAPLRLAVPSGRTAPLEYQDDGTVVASVKLQELFGLADTPRLGPRREPVTLSLLAPNGRPVQTTRDLKGFWERTYPEVRKELRGRYPRHPWPEDPWSAAPTHRAKPQGS